MTSLTLDDAEQRLSRTTRTFFSSATAAQQLGVGVDDARRLLARMEARSLTLRVCRDGWVVTWCFDSDEREAPALVAYLDDMMKHLGTGYYLSYAAAADYRSPFHHESARQRVNVATRDLGALELRHVDGPSDAASRFHQVDPRHRRPVASIGTFCLPPASKGRAAEFERRIVHVATAETILLDMVEHPERCGGMDRVATIALHMLFERQLHPTLLAEASDRYTVQVAQRAGSMLQILRGFPHRINLQPLWRRVRRRTIGRPVEMHNGSVDCVGDADRWGVTYSRRLEPGCESPDSLPWCDSGRGAVLTWLLRLKTRTVPTSRHGAGPRDRCRWHVSQRPARLHRIRSDYGTGFETTARG